MSIKLIFLLSVNWFNFLSAQENDILVDQVETYDCNVNDSLAIYKIIFDGNWSKDLFPKHYPEVRPPAHFSKTFGRTHNRNYTLFKVGKHASAGLRQFCEVGLSMELENEAAEMFDEFFIPHLKNPTGKIESRFFVKSNHTLISLVTKIIPSPDWFIGIPSLNLCRNHKWINNITIPARPFDCGTDSGLTFTAPNWRTDDPILRITPRYPRHQASSFYYTDMKVLPPIAFFRIQKIKEYLGVKEKTVRKMHQKFRRHENRIKNKKLIENDEKLGNQTKTKRNNTKRLWKTNKNETELKWREEYEIIDCIVSEWSEWSNCTKPCGLGEKKRQRQIIKEPKKNGKGCPSLTETRWCGSARGCNNGVPTMGSTEYYFKW